MGETVMPDYSGIRGDAPRGRYGQPLGFPGGPHWSDPDVPRFPMKGDRMATIPETKSYWEKIISEKDVGLGNVANDPRAHYGTKEMGLDDIIRRIKLGEAITDEEGVEYVKYLNKTGGRTEDIKMFIEYLNRQIKQTPPPEERRGMQEDIMRRSA